MLNNATTLIQVVVGDKAYQINFTLQDALGAVVDLTGATLTFQAQLVNDASVQFSGAMVIASAPTGTCAYSPQQTDFPVAGNYNCQVVVVYSGTGEKITFDNILILATARVPQ